MYRDALASPGLSTRSRELAQRAIAASPERARRRAAARAIGGYWPPLPPSPTRGLFAMGATEAFASTAEIGHYVDGRRVAGTSGRRQPVFNPATGAISRQVALAAPSEVDAAVAARKAAQPAGPTRRRCAAPASCTPSSTCSTSTATRSPR
jgi:hypothetical protein